MNKTYIKRQLTLHKLGIPMNKDIQEYVDYFNELIGDLSELTKYYGTLYNIFDGYLYFNDSNVLMFYDIKSEKFLVDYNNIWRKFKEKFKLNIIGTDDILICILGETFDHKITTIDYIRIWESHNRDNIFKLNE